MTPYVLFGKYTPEALKQVSSARTKQAAAIVEANGGRVVCVYVTLGAQDLIAVVEAPSLASAMKLSVELTKELGIQISTSPALSVDAFDALIGK